MKIIKIKSLLLFIILITSLQIYSQQKQEDFHHWNLTMAGGITRYLSNNIYEPDTTKNDLGLDINYLEYRIGYQFNKHQEINFAIRKIAFWHPIITNGNANNYINGDMLKSNVSITFGYRFLFLNKDNNNFYAGVDLGGLPNMDNILFNLQGGVKMLLIKNIYFDPSLNYSMWISNLLFKRNYSKQIRLNLGLNIKL